MTDNNECDLMDAIDARVERAWAEFDQLAAELGVDDVLDMADLLQMLEANEEIFDENTIKLLRHVLGELEILGYFDSKLWAENN